MARRGTLLALAALLALAPSALAHDEAAEPEPTVGEDDFDTGAPASDERYLDEETTAEDDAAEPDPGVSEDDFDVGAPPADESYLDAAAAEAGIHAEERSRVPAPGLLAALGALALAALAVAGRRRRR